MSIEIITIGDELLAGMTVNTNAAWLSEKLTEHWNVVRQTTLPDDPEALKSGLKEALKRSAVVIATGGLGPTLDDQTANCAAALFKEAPQKMANSVGSASGLIYTSSENSLILLPGVPQEMRAMLEESALPYLRKHIACKKEFCETVRFCLLKEMEVDPFLRELKIKYGIYPAYGMLTVRLLSSDQAAIEGAKREIQEKFSKNIIPEISVERTIHDWMIGHQKTVAFAESCTGGLMAARLTALPGASNYFLGSVVAYSNALKEKILGVSSKTLQDKGAVSPETVKQMLGGLFRLTDADYGVAVSGIAGPTGGSSQKPVGTVYYALGAREKSPEVGTFVAKGNREVIISLTSMRLLGLLWLLINNR